MFDVMFDIESIISVKVESIFSFGVSCLVWGFCFVIGLFVVNGHC